MHAYTDKELNDVFHRLYPDPAGFLYDEQMTIIKNILSGRDTLNILPTGAGKSFCFQVPALLTKGITIVVEPLVELLRDQTETLLSRKIPAACISASLIIDREGMLEKKDLEENGAKRRETLFQDIVREQGGDSPGRYRFLYVTPERLCTPAFLRFAEQAEISMIVVDEAHCISMWGYEFRRQYLMIPRFLSSIHKRPRIAAFTATAPEEVRRDICRFLDLEKPLFCPSVRTETLSRRENLRFFVRGKKEKGETVFRREVQNTERIREICRYVNEHRQEKGIIFCTTVRQVNAVYDVLRKNPGLEVTRYFADLDEYGNHEEGESRTINRNRFLNGTCSVIVATNALGMGIDLPDVQYVLHAEMPLSIENYYQEAGRAGRKGENAECILYWLPQDRETCMGLVDRNLKESSLDSDMRKLRRKIQKERLDKMEQYCLEHLDAGLDGQDALLDYFSTFRPEADSLLEKKAGKKFLRELHDVNVLYMNNTRTANEIRKGKTEGTYRVNNRNRKREKTVTFRLSEVLTPFDMMVFDAVCTLMANGCMRIYAKSAAELLAGTHDVMLRPERTEAINNVIRKLMRTYIRIDFRDAMDMYFLYDSESDGILEGSFLPLEETGNGFSASPGVLPPLYLLGRISGRILTFPLEALRFVPGEFPEPYRVRPALADALASKTDCEGLTVNRRRPSVRISFHTDTQLSGDDLLFADGVFSLLREGSFTFTQEAVLRVLYEDFRLVKDRRRVSRDPGQTLHKTYLDRLGKSLDRLSKTHISIMVSDQEQEVFSAEGIFLPVRKTTDKYAVDPDDLPPLYVCGKFLDSLMPDQRKQQTSRGHASFENMVLVYTVLHALRSAPGSYNDRNKYHSRTASMIRIDRLKEALPEEPSQQFNRKVNRLFRHLKKRGYILEYGLVRNIRDDTAETVEFCRYDKDIDMFREDIKYMSF